MKRLFTKYGLLVLAAAVLAAIALSVMAFFTSTSAPLPNLAGIIASPFRAAGAAIAETVDTWKQRLGDMDALTEENRLLRQQIADKESQLRQADLDREENRRLRALLELKQQRRDFQFAAANVTGSDTSNWASVLTIDQGTADGVAVGDCVVDEYGNLAGVITEAGLNWASVRTVLDSDSSIGATVFRSGLTVLAQGDFSLMQEGRLLLDYLGSDPDVITGDLVTTSGLGGYYPSGLVIGYVEELTLSDDGLSRRALLRPQAEIDTLAHLYVITDFDITG